MTGRPPGRCSSASPTSTTSGARRRPTTSGQGDAAMSTSQARTARREELRAWYDAHVDGFRAVEAALLDHLGGALLDARLDDARLETRTKDVESFLKKAT